MSGSRSAFRWILAFVGGARTAPRVDASAADAELGKDEAHDQEPGHDDAEKNEDVLHGAFLAQPRFAAKLPVRLVYRPCLYGECVLTS